MRAFSMSNETLVPNWYFSKGNFSIVEHKCTGGVFAIPEHICSMAVGTSSASCFYFFLVRESILTYEKSHLGYAERL